LITVIDQHQQDSVHQTPHHLDATAKACSVEFTAVSRGTVNKLATEKIDPLQQSVQNHPPFALDIPCSGVELRLLRSSGADVARLLPEKARQIFVVEDAHHQVTLVFQHYRDVFAGVDGEEAVEKRPPGLSVRLRLAALLVPLPVQGVEGNPEAEQRQVEVIVSILLLASKPRIFLRGFFCARRTAPHNIPR
jgi:hypothetical protein